MRIIAGKHKGRNIISPSSMGIRPTSSIMREAMFNMILSNKFLIPGVTKVVDLCCGTGALGLEALSRGAKQVVFIDGSQKHLALAKQNVENFGELANAKFIVANATKLINASDQFELVFIDPPYQKKIADKALNALYQKNWLSDGAAIIVETSRSEDVSYNSKYFEEFENKIFGNSKFLILISKKKDNFEL